MSTSSTRGLRLLKGLERYTKLKPNQWDTSTVLSKVKILSASEGHLRSSFTVESIMCNPLDTLHGGYISTIIDVLSLYGQMSHEQGKAVWTTNMNVVYLQAAFKGDKISVEVNPIRVSKTTLMEVTLRTESGAMVAKGTTVFMHGNDKCQRSAQEVLGFDFNEN